MVAAGRSWAACGLGCRCDGLSHLLTLLFRSCALPPSYQIELAQTSGCAMLPQRPMPRSASWSCRTRCARRCVAHRCLRRSDESLAGSAPTSCYMPKCCYEHILHTHHPSLHTFLSGSSRIPLQTCLSGEGTASLTLSCPHSPAQVAWELNRRLLQRLPLFRWAWLLERRLPAREVLPALDCATAWDPARSVGQGHTSP